MKVPDRWLAYKAMGEVIPGTRFVACKVPLKEGFLKPLPTHERFGPEQLVTAFPNIGLLVDLTNTDRYYSKQVFTDKKIEYEKIFCPGHVLPANSIIKQFFSVVDKFLLENNSSDSLIVVHCTHGVNRTGYFICRYMIEQMKMVPEEALKRFQEARGHGIERENYVHDLNNGCKGGSESSVKNGKKHHFKKRENKVMPNKLRYNRMDYIPENKKERVAVNGQIQHTGRPDNRRFKPNDADVNCRQNQHNSRFPRDSQIPLESWRREPRSSGSSQYRADFKPQSAQTRLLYSEPIHPRNFQNNFSSQYSWGNKPPLVSNSFRNADATRPPSSFLNQQHNASWRPLPRFCYSTTQNGLPRPEPSEGSMRTYRPQETLAESSTPNTQPAELSHQHTSFKRDNRQGPPQNRWSKL